MLAPAANLRQASRLGKFALSTDRVSAIELMMLAACGLLSALVTFGLPYRFGVPGTAILRTVFPMALGLAIVPRRWAGSSISICAGLTAVTMRLAGFGHAQPAAIAGVVALGPLVDLVVAGAPLGWKLYLRFVTAGIVANLASFAVRFVIAWLGWQRAGSHNFLSFWPMALVSFVLCGAVAGLVSAICWFRLRVDNDLHRSR